MPPAPLVSIIIPTYNRRQFVTDAIDSCLAQTHDNCEIIVVDDGSTDGTGRLLRERYGDALRYFYQDNQGPGIARNRGIAEAKGDFIHFLDADDQLHEAKIAICLDAFCQRPAVSVIYTHFQQVASDGATPVETGAFESYSADVFCELLRQTGCRILTSSSMCRADALRSIGGFEDDVKFRSAEDWDLFLRLAMRYRFHGIDRPLVHRRVHENMISDDKLAGAYGRLKTIQNARHYGWERCMPPAEFARKLSARHHVYALYLWAAGERRDARHHFLLAAEIYPPQAKQRRLYAIYTRFLPPISLDITLAAVRFARRLLRQRPAGDQQ
ncbi:MAG: glycosyltransferase [Chloroflexota bacterium]|nr:glycosyltransferase [Chloroflexota bacterium]